MGASSWWQYVRTKTNVAGRKVRVTMATVFHRCAVALGGLVDGERCLVLALGHEVDGVLIRQSLVPVVEEQSPRMISKTSTLQ